ALFQALFPLDGLMVYIGVRAGLGEKGLRLRLHLPPDLAPLPWELLYYPPHYLALDPRSPVVRFLDLPETPRPLAVQPPLRLLHLVAAPVDLPPLDVEGEASRLREALAPLADKVEIVPAPAGTLAALRQGLRQGCCLFHFSGHGGFAQGRGRLFFETEQGRSEGVDGDTLAHLLRGSDVRLALLNACESARAEAGDAFGSVAANLVRAGLPAVIAHQQAMPDGSAVAFAVEFYRALADGYPVDAAVGEGRKAVLAALGADWRASMDWAIPTLLMRARDGRILDLKKSTAGEGTTPGGASFTAQQMTVVNVGAISGGQFSFDMNIGPGQPQPQTPPPAADPLPGLLSDLRRAVREQAPSAQRGPALEKVAALRGAVAELRPDLALLESIWRWFDARLPALSGAVLSVILSLEPRLEAAGDDALWADFQQRFLE
ncbi:MAG TPA: CHAT domain-containing protein, partial [Anaerolineae bacterium]|nr:CHAT domain-containing protein [Anaerolineae bacterium]